MLVSLSVNSALAWTASHLSTLSIEEDLFRNYDFGSDWDNYTNCSWPVTMLFWNNAEIDKVKSQYRLRDWILWGYSEWAKLNETGDDWIWDTDRGVKKPIGLNFIHMRVYADSDDQLYNISWGYYILGTTHYDKDGETKCGWSEEAEQQAALVAESVPGWGVVEDWGNFYNYEPLRKEVDEEGNEHWWQCGGYATAVYVP